MATSTVITLNFGIYTAIDGRSNNSTCSSVWLQFTYGMFYLVVPLVIRSVTIKVLHGERITEVLRLGAL